MTSESLLSSLQRLTVHDHVCLIYESRQEQCAAVVPFIRIGLERGEKCLYVADEKAAGAALSAMRSDGIDVDAHLSSGALTVPGEREPCPGSGFCDPDRMIECLKRHAREAERQGCSALRIAVEMTWAPGGEAGMKRLIEYENKLNVFFPEHNCCALCQYNVHKFTPEIIRDVICTHPCIIYRSCVYTNCCFIPPDEFSFRNIAQHQVSCFLKNIQERGQTLEALRESEQRQQKLLDAAAEGIIVQEASGEISVWNSGAERIFGLPAAEVVGRSAAVFDWPTIHEDGSPFHADEHPSMITLQTGRPCSYVLMGVIKGPDDVCWISINTRPLFDGAESKPKAAVITFRDITEVRNARIELERRGTLERILSDVSYQLVLDDFNKTDSGINYGLAEIGRFMDVDRAYVFLLRADGKIIDNTHEWCAAGVAPYRHQLQGIVFDEELPWIAGHIRTRSVAYVPDVDRMTSESGREKEHFRKQDIQSLIAVPMEIDSCLVGLLGFDAVRTRREWTEFEQDVLRRTGEIFARTLERKQHEAALRHSEEKLLNAQYIAKLGDFTWDIESGAVVWSAGMYRLLQYDVSEKIDYHTVNSRIHHPEDVQRVQQWLADSIASGREAVPPTEFRLIRKDGTTIYVHTEGRIEYRDGKAVTFFGTCQDITCRRQAEDELRDREERLQLALAGADLGAWDCNIPTKQVQYNQRWAEMLGYRLDELEPHFSTWQSLVHPDDLPRVTDMLNAHLNGDTPFFEAEFRMHHKSGTWVWILGKGRIIERDFEGTPVRACGTHLDITDRRQAEEENIRLLSAIEQADEAIIITDEHGTIQFANLVIERRTGLPREQMAGKNLFFPESGFYDDTFYRDIWKTVSSGRIWKSHLKHKNPDGAVCDYFTVITPIKNTDGRIINYVSVSRDITREVQLEENLRQSQKMESLGTLAGGVAHEFNNILGGIIGYTELSKDAAPQSSPIHHNLNKILQMAGRASTIVRQILTFSHKSPVNKMPHQPHAVIMDQIKMLRNIVPAHIEIKTAIDEHAGTIIADATQMQQVGMNLCTNAVHAMEETGGVLSVTLSAVDLDERAVQPFHNIEPGRYVQLTVSDTGQGIDPAIIDRIFDPFFTTKETNKGTGLGLSVVDGIIKQHGGAISVESEPGRGTTFTVVLPLVELDAYEEPPAEEKDIPGGTETILIVDDEDSIVTPMKMMLERIGYQVTAMTDSLAGLQRFKKSPHDFDLIITDLSMPGLTGDRLAAGIRAVRPDIAIVLMTGYSDMIDHDRITAIGVKHIIPKPCERYELATAIRAVLDDG